MTSLSADEHRAWREALQSSFSDIVRFLIPRIEDDLGVETALLDLLAEDASLAPGVGKAVMALPSASRARVLPEVAADPRAEVRRALFREWAPDTLEAPRERSALVLEPQWTNVLRAALGDDELSVRTAGTALVFDSDVGDELTPELLSNLDAPDEELRRRTLLALGAARDPESLARLEAALRSENESLAAAAVRALAARPDGRASWRAALGDPRPQVRDAALFALARVVTDLEPGDLAGYEAATSPEALRAAARSYRQRRGGAA